MSVAVTVFPVLINPIRVGRKTLLHTVFQEARLLVE